MRIETAPGAPYDGPELWVVLTEGEARDLAEALTVYFSEAPRDPEWHSHVGDVMTLAIEAAEVPLGLRVERGVQLMIEIYYG